MEHRFKISVDCFRPHCQRNVKVQQYIVHSCWLVRLEVYVCKRAFQHEVCIICSNPFSFTNIFIYMYIYIFPLELTLQKCMHELLFQYLMHLPGVYLVSDLQCPQAWSSVHMLENVPCQRKECFYMKVFESVCNSMSSCVMFIKALLFHNGI